MGLVVLVAHSPRSLDSLSGQLSKNKTNEPAPAWRSRRVSLGVCLTAANHSFVTPETGNEAPASSSLLAHVC